MIETLLIILRRLCVCGMFSAVVLAIAKESASREIIRICCACMMIIAMFSPVSSRSEKIELDFERQDFKTQADMAVESFRQSQNQAMCREIAEYAMQRAGGTIAAEGILKGEIMKITAVTVSGDGYDKEKITEVLVKECGINSACITFLEG